MLQILTVLQQATCVVKGFPYIPDKPKAFEVVAALRGEFPILALSQPPEIEDFEHHTNWQLVVNYLKILTKENLDKHVPLTSAFGR